jgi:hypothetical protein
MQFWFVALLPIYLSFIISSNYLLAISCYDFVINSGDEKCTLFYLRLRLLQPAFQNITKPPCFLILIFTVLLNKILSPKYTRSQYVYHLLSVPSDFLVLPNGIFLNETQKHWRQSISCFFSTCLTGHFLSTLRLQKWISKGHFNTYIFAIAQILYFV